jgi:hypothetical protein
MGRHGIPSSVVGSPATRAVIHYKKLSAIILAAVLFYNEYYAYYSAYSDWPSEAEGKDATTATNILFVADPQLQGIMDERPFPVGSITRWDADRYMRKTFSWVISYYTIDAIVFLGDLIDEGSRTVDKATYDQYVARFRSIYPVDSAKVMEQIFNLNSPSFYAQPFLQLMVYLSGDNDVGGEGEPVTEDKVKRFREQFAYTPGLNAMPRGRKADLVVLNTLTMNSTQLLSIKEPSDDRFRIGVSHVSLIPLAER